MLSFLTGLLVIVTGFYVVATFEILKSHREQIAVMKKELDLLSRPCITISPMTVARSPILYLKIANTGKNPAENLKLEIDRDFYVFGEETESHRLSNFNAFKNGIKLMPPASELLFHLASAIELFKEDVDQEITPHIFDIKATYSYRKNRIEEVTTVDLSSYRGSAIIPDRLIEQLEKLTRAVKKM